jgi:hypothetical protein
MMEPPGKVRREGQSARYSVPGGRRDTAEIENKGQIVLLKDTGSLAGDGDTVVTEGFDAPEGPGHMDYQPTEVDAA